jgi:hypothetical protein
MNLNNLILHITLPKGIKTTDGAVLMSDITYDVASALTPFYASIEQVKLTGGVPLRKISDMTLASQIYMASKSADMMNYHPPKPSTHPEYLLFLNARNQWVMARAALDLMLSLGNLLNPASHVLANFSVTTSKADPGEGVAGKIAGLTSTLKLYDPSVRSGGRTAPGGHARPQMAAKGVMDWQERSPGRTWARNSVGANTESADYGSPVGGRGKPVSYFAHSIYSPSICNFRLGAWQSSYNLYNRGWAF